jgi:hypothetical protein
MLCRTQAAFTVGTGAAIELVEQFRAVDVYAHRDRLALSAPRQETRSSALDIPAALVRRNSRGSA